MADGEREGGNKVERGRARTAGQMGRGWTQSSSAASIPVRIPVQAGTSRSYMRGEVPTKVPDLPASGLDGALCRPAASSGAYSAALQD